MSIINQNQTKMNKIKEQAGCNAPASEAQIKMCNVKLKQHNLPELPEAYVKVLQEANGITQDDANVFGVDTQTEWFVDVCEYNINHQKTPSTKLIIGYDDDTRVIYDSQDKVYKVVSTELDITDMESSELLEVLEYFLRIQ